MFVVQAFHKHRQVLAQRARTLSVLLMRFEADTPSRCATRLGMTCPEQLTHRVRFVSTELTRAATPLRSGLRCRGGCLCEFWGVAAMQQVRSFGRRNRTFAIARLSINKQLYLNVTANSSARAPQSIAMQSEGQFSGARPGPSVTQRQAQPQ